MTRASGALVIHQVGRADVLWSIGSNPKHHATHQNSIARALADISDSTTGEVWLGEVTGEWVDESDLLALDDAIRRARTNQDDTPHAYVPDPTNERRCYHCEALPGHCTGGAA